MKGLYLLVGGVAIAFLSVGTLQVRHCRVSTNDELPLFSAEQSMNRRYFQIYKRTCLKRTSPPQGQQMGVPVGATYEIDAASRGSSPRTETPAPSTPAPAPVHADMIR